MSHFSLRKWEFWIHICRTIKNFLKDEEERQFWRVAYHIYYTFALLHTNTVPPADITAPRGNLRCASLALLSVHGRAQVQRRLQPMPGLRGRAGHAQESRGTRGVWAWGSFLACVYASLCVLCVFTSVCPVCLCLFHCICRRAYVYVYLYALMYAHAHGFQETVNKSVKEHLLFFFFFSCVYVQTWMIVYVRERGSLVLFFQCVYWSCV